MGATKDQESAMLAKIRKIVDELGEDSYIATAMKGVWETADQNIEYDAAFSLAKERDLFMQRNREMEKELSTMQAAQKQACADSERVASAAQHQKDQNQQLEQQIDALRKQLEEEIDIAADMKNSFDLMRHENLILKAKLYDYMTTVA